MLCAAPVVANPPQPPPAVAPTADLPWVPDEVILVFRDEPAPRALSDLRLRDTSVRDWRAMRHRLLAVHTAREAHPLSRMRVVRLAPGQDVMLAAERFSRLPGVAYAHPNYVTQAAFEPNDPRYNLNQYAPQIIRADQAWNITTGDPNVVVAIADSGVLFTHQDMAGAFWSNDDPVNGVDDDGNGFVDDFRGWDFMNNDNDPSFSGAHGTHTTGIVGARINNGLGIAGMSNCTVMPLQAFTNTSGTWEAIINSIYYAVDNGARVINYSGGATSVTPAMTATALQDAVQYAYKNGVPLVAAAGNFTSGAPRVASNFYPAAYAESFAVAGTGDGDVYYDRSRFGPWIDFAAPGIGVYTTHTSSTASYVADTGTSFAAPHVAGLIALMFSINPALGIEEIRDLICHNSMDLGAVGFDELYGCGRIDAKATLDAVANDLVPPYIVHDAGIGTFPWSGYIDPRTDSTDGVALNSGINQITIKFNEPVRDVGSGVGGPLTTASFSIADNGVANPTINSIDASGNPTVVVHLSGPIAVGAWTTIIAGVEDLSGDPIVSTGNMADMDEPDRVDIGFLPGDVDNNGGTEPVDLIRFRQIYANTVVVPVGEPEDYADIDRNGAIQPFDLIRFRQLLSGTSPATQSWLSQNLPPRP
ncbi:MAG: S8 family serine peptidase [Phycisphaerales bacterium]|nr:S8 family serine peptidase [Phycisphaerales bacterium]